MCMYKKIKLLYVLLLSCISLTAYAEENVSIQFALYSDKPINNTISFDVVNDTTNEVSHYYLYQENGHMETIQLPVGSYHLSGAGIEETSFTVEETLSSAVKKVYVIMSSSKNSSISMSTNLSNESKTEKSEDITSKEEMQTSKQKENKIFHFLKSNAICFIVLIIACIALIIIKKHENLD